MERTSKDGNRKAAWTLVVLAPASAEVTFSGVNMPFMWLLLPALVVMYGSGVLLLRELVARCGGGWPSLLVAGVVYELVEDGIGLQALTSPNLYGAAEWGPRVLGFNTAYWESQIGYHTVFSVLIPVLLADLIFPGHRGRPYLLRGGMAVAALGTVAGVAMLRVLIAATEDPGYQAPLPVVLGILAAVAVLLLLALRVLPGRTPVPGPSAPNGRRAPRPVFVALMGGAASVCFLGLLMPPGLLPGRPDADGTITWAGFVPMVLAAAVAGGAGWLVHRWSGAVDWSDGYWIRLAGGALIGRTLYAVVTAPAVNDYEWGPSAVAFTVGTVMIAAMAFLLARLDRRIRRRAAERASLAGSLT
ncbi:hypothetical protein DB35_17680 [Streptomyces abyssalis]|uniref:Uncharacterized protein n=1 Tax=Streptomyces abyssalis TaxID=933944 RepID=A0A1E7JKS3_9ACTN|nr:hypothetical protein [Streptomyces abyssalis]OEU88215.1 hypothetical protein AN215_18850 [Streptomyces abyssalis]OEU91086.1 hypothetical protein DB35_17680 [Streptomyces abyssalis]OEV31614.1 hypothetical protein AN219_03985 [Streptomyces nanshensis]